MKVNPPIYIITEKELLEISMKYVDWFSYYESIADGFIPLTQKCPFISICNAPGSGRHEYSARLADTLLVEYPLWLLFRWAVDILLNMWKNRQQSH